MNYIEAIKKINQGFKIYLPEWARFKLALGPFDEFSLRWFVKKGAKWEICYKVLDKIKPEHSKDCLREDWEWTE